MDIDGVGRSSGSAPQAAAAPAQTGAAGFADSEFARTLRTRLSEPRTGVERVRAEIDAIRDGRVLFQGPVSMTPAATPGVSSSGDLGQYRAAIAYAQSAGGPDPFGWRELARQLGESVVAPGFGPIFEAQIAQESGFSPEVAFGLRVSSAGAEGIAQLMPQYYPHVDRTDPQASLVAGARTMHHYLEALDGDVRKALAAYNAGLGRVQSLVRTYGEAWEQGLPDETKLYLSSILGGAGPTIPTSESGQVAVFGGQDPGGVLVSPLGSAFQETREGLAMRYLGTAGAMVSAPASAAVVAVRPSPTGTTLVLDHGGGWLTTIEGLDTLVVSIGDRVERSQQLGTLAPDAASERGWLRLGVSLDGRPLDAGRYLLRP